MAVRPTDQYPERPDTAPDRSDYVEPSTAPVRPTYAERTVEQPVDRRVVITNPPVREFGGLSIVRILLTLAGAAAMIVGAFAPYVASVNGVELTYRAFFRIDTTTAAFVASVGGVMIVLGLLAIVGLTFRSGWLTRLAGALGIVGFVLFVIELFRAPGALAAGDIGWGAWLTLAGAIVALIGGFFTSRPAVVAPLATDE
jgi:hypothetical protein